MQTQYAIGFNIYNKFNDNYNDMYYMYPMYTYFSVLNRNLSWSLQTFYAANLNQPLQIDR